MMRVLGAAPVRVQTQTSPNTQQWQLREATRQMEAQFLHQLLRAMRRTVPSTQNSSATQVYTDMLDEALAQQLARSDQFGLGKLLYEKLSVHLQTADSPVSAAESTPGGSSDDETQ